jgi:hypothetical protein
MTIVAPSRHDLSLLGVFRHHTSAAAKPWQPPEPATTWSECVNDKVNDKAANGKTKFDWVTERSSCSLPKVFNTLRLEVAEDVKTRNALRPNNSPYEFSIAEKGEDFTVLLKTNDAHKSVTFSLAQHGIVVRDDNGDPMFEVTPTFSDEGKCRLNVNGQERETWQVRRMALEELMFQGN